jgi:hypothetical protein
MIDSPALHQVKVSTEKTKQDGKALSELLEEISIK